SRSARREPEREPAHPTPPMLPYEHELGEPVSAWLTARGLKVYAEVPRPASDTVVQELSRGVWREVRWPTPWGNVDAVGVRWRKREAVEVVAVELKRRLDRTALRQATDNLQSCHESWIAVWATSPAMQGEAARSGIGVLIVGDAGAVRVASPAAVRPCDGAAELASRAKQTPK